MTDQYLQTVARKILYILVEEQRLHPGDGMPFQMLTRDLERHGMTAKEQQEGIAQAIQNDWLRSAPEDVMQLTDQGFRINFGQ